MADSLKWWRVAQQVQVSQAYKESDLGWLLYHLVSSRTPTTCLELGTYAGYTTLFIAAAIAQYNTVYEDEGYLDCFDLWEQYQYNHVNRGVALQNIKDAGLLDYVSMTQKDALEVPDIIEMWGDRVDFIYVDLSNDGDTYRWAANEFYDLLWPGAIIVLEGGVPERDQVSWMLDYNKRPIVPTLEEIQETGKYDICQVMGKFPGLTVMTRK